MRIIRRLGSTPQERGSLSNGHCPDIFELGDGRFAVIGTVVSSSEDLEEYGLPPDASMASYERMVVVPREVLLHAKRDIPDM